MSADDNTSSLKSYMDSATGAIQSGIASVTGSAGDQAKADQTKSKAQLENDASHATVKAGPFTLSSSGAVAQDNPDRTAGSYDQTMGSAKEAVGNLVGSEDLRRSGVDQNQSGKAQEAKGQLSDLGTGFTDRAQGAVGGAVAGLTGDRSKQQEMMDRHDEGKARQRGAESDMDKKAGY